MRHLHHGHRCAWLALALLVAACSKDKSVDQPAKLTVFKPTLRVQHEWSATVDNKKALPLRLGLGLAVDNNRVYAAGHKGDVEAFDLQKGHRAWRVNLKAPLSGGTAAAGELVLIGSSDGRLFALNAADGKTRWQTRLNGEVLAAPAISAKVIAVRTGDGKLHGLNPADGHELWALEQQVPRLSLRGTARPIIVGDVVLCGFDNGKVLAVNGSDGSVQWEATVTPPHGRTELERLSDIDSTMWVQGQNVYAVGFQGRVAMLALETGQVWWSHEMSSYRGMTLDDDNLYVSTADGEVVALNARTGAEVWRQSVLLHRGLTAPANMDNNAIVLADFQGYVHWLDKASGTIIGRTSGSNTRVSSAPVVVGDLVLVVNDRGQIRVYRASPLATKGKKQAAAPASRAPASCATAGRPAGRAAGAGDAGAGDAGARGNTPVASGSTPLPPSAMLPVIALVGRPNVGKSTLFNVLTGTRDAIVADVPGLTRDRQYGFARLGPVPCVVIDTGGLVENPVGLAAQMRAQTERAVAEADRLIFLADARAGLTSRRTISSPVSCAAPASR